MKTLRIVSWNLRTFGDPPPGDQALRDMTAIMINALTADIVCVQEVQCGDTTSALIGGPIGQNIVNQLNRLLQALRAADPKGDWQGAYSGLNSQRSDSMRDAYAFFWKAQPAASPLSHANASPRIAILQEPVILRKPGTQDNFPGRRPGMASFHITDDPSAPPVLLNIASWHAPTPCNSVGKAKNGPSSGRGLFALATLTEIGGYLRQGTTGGRAYEWVDGEPLPDVDTIFLGDCNYSMDASQAEDVYDNLTTNYEPCISSFDKIVRTTYSADPTKPFTSVSSYDNIFALKPHDKFVPAVTFNGTSGAYDFIAVQAKSLGDVSGIQYFANEACWYVCYLDQYKKQNAKQGISDHLPVYADFSVSQGSTANSRVLPTSGTNNNCLFHAVYGAPDLTGQYVDAQAAQHRTWFVQQLTNALQNNFPAIRDFVLRSMINQFGDTPNWVNLAQFLLSNSGVNPSLYPQWPFMVAAYLQGISAFQRMLWADEAAMLAMFAGITINLRTINQGVYQNTPLNAGQQNSVDIYHFGLHFFRFNPN